MPFTNQEAHTRSGGKRNFTASTALTAGPERTIQKPVTGSSSIVWTRGPNFPLSRLDGRLMCPRCRSRRVAVLFQPPTVSNAASG
jgi:hypothetical protein